MFFTEMIASGKYIKIKLSLCHNPSLEITVFANSFLSDITNIAKKTKRQNNADNQYHQAHHFT